MTSTTNSDVAVVHVWGAGIPLEVARSKIFWAWIVHGPQQPAH